MFVGQFLAPLIDITTRLSWCDARVGCVISSNISHLMMRLKLMRKRPFLMIKIVVYIFGGTQICCLIAFLLFGFSPNSSVCSFALLSDEFVGAWLKTQQSVSLLPSENFPKSYNRRRLGVEVSVNLLEFKDDQWTAAAWALNQRQYQSIQHRRSHTTMWILHLTENN